MRQPSSKPAARPAALAFGVAKSGSVRNRQALATFLAPLNILPFDAAAVWAYGDLCAELERRGTPIGSLNTMIAAHALSRRATLVTNNTREFAKVPGLQLDIWVAATSSLCRMECLPPAPTASTNDQFPAETSGATCHSASLDLS